MLTKHENFESTDVLHSKSDVAKRCKKMKLLKKLKSLRKNLESELIQKKKSKRVLTTRLIFPPIQ